MKPFIPKIGDQPYYYFINHHGRATQHVFLNDIEDQYRIQTGNCYPTLEAAEYHRAMETKAWQIRQSAFEPDWSDQEQEKHYFYFDHDGKEYKHCYVYFAQAARTYFDSEKTARSAFADVSNYDFLYMQSIGLI